MIGSTRRIRVYCAPGPTDMRGGYNRLFSLAKNVICQDPMDGHLFLFVAKNKKSAKVLFWDGTGLCILMKRLEKGCFVAPWERESLTMTESELRLFLEGSKAVRFGLSPAEFFLTKPK